MNFYKVGFVCAFLMSVETLGDCVRRRDESKSESMPEGESIDEVFLSSDPLTKERHQFYIFDSLNSERECGDLCVLPGKYDGEKFVPNEESVGVLYWQHKNDRIHAA